VVAEVTTSIETSDSLGQAARQQRLLDYLRAAGLSEAQAEAQALHLVQTQGAGPEAVRLSTLLLAARARLGCLGAKAQGELATMAGVPCYPAATPAAAPLEMPTRAIPLRRFVWPF
jgi:hypothetical protein